MFEPYLVTTLSNQPFTDLTGPSFPSLWTALVAQCPPLHPPWAPTIHGVLPSGHQNQNHPKPILLFGDPKQEPMDVMVSSQQLQFPCPSFQTAVKDLHTNFSLHFQATSLASIGLSPAAPLVPSCRQFARHTCKGLGPLQHWKVISHHFIGMS